MNFVDLHIAEKRDNTKKDLPWQTGAFVRILVHIFVI